MIVAKEKFSKRVEGAKRKGEREGGKLSFTMQTMKKFLAHRIGRPVEGAADGNGLKY